MKNLIYLITVFLILLYGCSKDQIGSEQIASVDNSIKAKLGVLERIKSLGFDTTKIDEHKDYFLVEGDIMFQKNESQYRLKQARTTNIVLHKDIKVYLSTNFSLLSNIGNALDEVLFDYNNLNSGLSFSRVFSAGDANIVISSVSASSIGWACALASFPQDGYPGGTIVVGEDLVYYYYGSLSQLKYLLAHELGHTIGLRHTNWWAEPEPIEPWGATTVPGTYSEDIYSIMNAGGCGNEYGNGFSYYDGVAILNLYPRPTIIGATDLTGIIRAGETYNYSYIGNGYGPFSWTINNAQVGYYWELPPTTQSIVLYTIYDSSLVNGVNEINNLDVYLQSGQSAHLEISVKDGYRLYTSSTLPRD